MMQKTDICEHAIEGLGKSCVKTVHIVGRRGPLQVRYAIVKLLLTATSLQWPLFLDAQFIHWLLFGHQPLSSIPKVAIVERFDSMLPAHICHGGI